MVDVTSRRRRRERGAAVVEFALLVPVLFAILFGVLQYGLYFNDALSADQAVREAARKGVVLKSAAACGGSGWAAIRCTVEDQIEGDSYVMLAAPQGWGRGKTLIVCAVMHSKGDLGLVPLPHHGYVHSSVRMSIEDDSTAPSGGASTDSLPSGQDWSWCT